MDSPLHSPHLFVTFFWFFYLLTWQPPPFLMITSCSPSFFSLPAMPTFCNRFFSLVCPPFLMSLSDIPPFKLLQFALLPSFEFSATICNVFCFWSPVKRAKLPQRVKRIGGFYCREWEKKEWSLSTAHNNVLKDMWWYNGAVFGADRERERAKPIYDIRPLGRESWITEHHIIVSLFWAMHITDKGILVIELGATAKPGSG